MAASNQRWWAVGALALASLTLSLDTTVLNVALPTLATELRATTAQLQWFSAAYTFALAAALLPAGMLGDRYGRRSLLLGGLIAFGLASVACAFSTSPAELIVARVALGLAAAVLIPLSIAVLPGLFPDAAERKRAVFLWVTANAAGLPLGPIVGGWLLHMFWWGSVFLINVPLVAAGAVLVRLLVPESRGQRARPVDGVGVLLSSTGMLGLTYGFITIGHTGWTDPIGPGCVLAGIILLAVFIRTQRRVAHPLIDLSLFGVSAFRSGALLSAIVNFVLFGVLFALPLYFQAVQGANPFTTGLRLLPMIAGLIVGTWVAERIGRQVSVRVVVATGFGLLAVAMCIGATASVQTGYAHAALWTTLLGLGLGFAMPTAMSLGLSALTSERAGSGSALLQALRQIGGTVGVAVLGAVLNVAYLAQLPPNADAATAGVSAGVAAAGDDQGLVAAVREAFVHGMNIMLAACAVVAVCAVALGLLTRDKTRKEFDERSMTVES